MNDAFLFNIRIKRTILQLQTLMLECNKGSFEFRALSYLVRRLQEMLFERENDSLTQHERLKGILARIVEETDSINPQIGEEIMLIEEEYYGLKNFG